MAKQPKILVIDDDPAVLDLLRRKLAAHYLVIVTNDARKAVDLAHEHRPDAILCDLVMPRMNGAEVAAALGKDAALASVPVIYLTNVLSPEEMKALGGLVGGHRSVSKRAPIGEVISAIDAALPQ